MRSLVQHILLSRLTILNRRERGHKFRNDRCGSGPVINIMREVRRSGPLQRSAAISGAEDSV